MNIDNISSRGLNLGLKGIDQEKSVSREYLEAIVIAVLLAVFIRTFVVQAFKIPSGSMLPTLKIGDHLLVSKFIYGINVPFTNIKFASWKEITKGDIVVFRFPKNRSVDYIKRVVGVSGDTIELKNKVLYVNDVKVPDVHAHYTSSSIVDGAVSPRDNFGPVRIPESKIFVMGDNRDNSYDGRFWGFVDENDVLGKAMILYWSWDIDKDFFSLDRMTSVRWGRIGNIIE